LLLVERDGDDLDLDGGGTSREASAVVVAGELGRCQRVAFVCGQDLCRMSYGSVELIGAAAGRGPGEHGLGPP